MSANAHSFELLLLTASREVGLRRLRSYAASLGGGAHIFHTIEDLTQALKVEKGAPAVGKIIVNDGTVPLSSSQIEGLYPRARLFQLCEPRPQAESPLPVPAFPSLAASTRQPFLSLRGVGLETSLHCSLPVFLESPVIRASMAHICKNIRPFRLPHLLRWGHAAESWSAAPGGADAHRHNQEIAALGFGFSRRLSLSGGGLRLVEMVSHFAQTSLKDFGLVPRSMTFGSDGLLVLGSMLCPLPSESRLQDLAEDMREQNFPTTIFSRLPGGLIEIGCVYNHIPATTGATLPVFIIYDQCLTGAAHQEPFSTPFTMNKAG